MSPTQSPKQALLQAPAASLTPAPRAQALFDPAILKPAVVAAFLKLDPRQLMRNPVIFVTEVVAALVTGLWLHTLAGGSRL